MDREINIWYLFHSSYAIKVENLLLIFDYYIDKPAGQTRSLSCGVIEPKEISGYKTLVFSSHRHPDHFNPIIFNWRDQVDSIRYILSSDIPAKYHENDIITVKPRQTVNLDDGITITTLKSTDEGVAFLININGIIIYHAGDLNWWRWEEESKAWNNDMAARFKKELDALRGIKIDIAFLTADPRQKADSLLGLEYFIEQIGANSIFPMHFLNEYKIMDKIAQEQEIKPGLRPVHLVFKRGEQFKLMV